MKDAAFWTGVLVVMLPLALLDVVLLWLDRPVPNVPDDEPEPERCPTCGREM